MTASIIKTRLMGYFENWFRIDEPKKCLVCVIKSTEPLLPWIFPYEGFCKHSENRNFSVKPYFDRRRIWDRIFYCVNVLAISMLLWNYLNVMYIWNRDRIYCILLIAFGVECCFGVLLYIFISGNSRCYLAAVNLWCYVLERKVSEGTKSFPPSFCRGIRMKCLIFKYSAIFFSIVDLLCACLVVYHTRNVTDFTSSLMLLTATILEVSLFGVFVPLIAIFIELFKGLYADVMDEITLLPLKLCLGQRLKRHIYFISQYKTAFDQFNQYLSPSISVIFVGESVLILDIYLSITLSSTHLHHHVKTIQLRAVLMIIAELYLLLSLADFEILVVKMSPRKNRQNKIGDLDSNSDLESILQKLTLGITELQQTLSNVSVNVDNIERRTKVVDNETPTSMPGQQNIQQNVSCIIPITNDRRYIKNWSGLGGGNLTFYPNSKMHPMIFFNELNNILREAGVPDECKKGLALACLEGTAADWGSIKEDSFTTNEDFEKAFKDRFWGVEKQRELFLEFTYGRFESGNRSEYFLNLVRQSVFLDEKISDEKLICMIAKHFPADVQRGIITNGFTKFEEVEEFFLKVDDTYKYDSRQETRNNVNNPRRRYSNAVPSRDFGAPITRNQNNNSNQNSNVCSITSFNRDTENLLTDSDSEAEEKAMVSPTIKIRVGEQEIETLLDSGSDVCAVSERFYDCLKREMPNIPILPVSNLSIAVAVGGRTQRVENQILLPIKIAEFDMDVICLVVPNLNCNVLLGSNWFFKCKAVIDFDKSTLFFRSGEICHNIDNVFKLNSNQFTHIYRVIYDMRIINVYIEGKIKRNEVAAQIAEMLSWEIIKKEKTEFISPLVCVTRKDKTIRVCLDARMLNRKLKKDFVNPPNTNDLLLTFKKGQFLSTIDLTAAYWQIPIRSDHTKYIGIVYEGETYTFARLPFGLSTAMASLTRCLNTVLGEEFKEFTSVYVDDLLVHLIHLDKIFDTLGRAGLTVKLRKSQFLRHDVSFLGHIISADGVSIDKTRIECINKFPTPRNLRELRGFLGFVNYERRFCKNYADPTLPLLKLLKKGQKWKWGPEEEKAMRAIKDAYLKTVLIVHPDFNHTFYIQCDSSDYALGGSLYQLSNEGERQVVAYTCSTFKGSQLTYTTTGKEALAVVHCLRQWRNLILGRDLVILSDHKSLSFLLTCKLRSARLSRWIMFIEEFDFRIEHCKGSENTIDDVLSRFPSTKTSFAKPEVGNNVNIALMKLSNDFSMLKKHFKVLRTDQMHDEWIRNKIDFIENCHECVEITNEKDRNILRWFVIHGGILFKRGDVRCPGFKLCVPQNQRRDIILAHHKALGHFGKTKTHIHMRNMFYWPKILKHVRQIVADCDLCQKAKCSPKSRGLLNPIITKKPICLDMIGPLPQGRGGVTQISVIFDAFSKFVKLYASRRATSKAILTKMFKNQSVY
ncbi:hypothetical protein JTB14_011300 [Gonioctena quinquepunctata]|nr:hypothetical protein JTB14_011300 [Gonioctena quinquepunctata]